MTSVAKETDLEQALDGVRDSKQLSPGARDVRFEVIHQIAVGVSVGVSAPAVVDRDGLVPATRRAMRQALTRLSPQPGHLILDHLRLTSISLPQVAFPKADVHSYSVAAASIVAKVTRDRLMEEYHNYYPQFGFFQHKGYPTRAHKEAIRKFGYCPIHRQTFRGVKEYL